MLCLFIMPTKVVIEFIDNYSCITLKIQYSFSTSTNNSCKILNILWQH
jgi:hypothetical protein